ncbi:uncharacterized protein LOC122320781 [Drosophila ficusphila]|uniref:uncharacterized protein LOC108093466 n=1 Tax=Drosophila ficusphila TaxID=30025 RepID=UPI001C89D1F2|nr:uncharacterized protein LOC108093466 [Drosophila ficusphila]XP_043065208.1 uncharacterized protein LOC122320781 [Drosophila ficusphila]
MLYLVGGELALELSPRVGSSANACAKVGNSAAQLISQLTTKMADLITQFGKLSEKGFHSPAGGYHPFVPVPSRRYWSQRDSGVQGRPPHTDVAHADHNVGNLFSRTRI